MLLKFTNKGHGTIFDYSLFLFWWIFFNKLQLLKYFRLMQFKANNLQHWSVVSFGVGLLGAKHPALSKIVSSNLLIYVNEEGEGLFSCNNFCLFTSRVFVYWRFIPRFVVFCKTCMLRVFPYLFSAFRIDTLNFSCLSRVWLKSKPELYSRSVRRLC